nr:MAG TPA: hypothetical protein [Caudoviricetes sp.]
MFKKIFYWGKSPLKIEGIELSSDRPDVNNPEHDPRKILLINLDNKLDSGDWKLGWGKGSWELKVGNKLPDLTQILSSDIKQKKALKDIANLISYLMNVPELNQDEDISIDIKELGDSDNIPSYEELKGRLRAALIELESFKKMYAKKLDKKK